MDKIVYTKLTSIALETRPERIRFPMGDCLDALLGALNPRETRGARIRCLEKVFHLGKPKARGLET